MVSPTGKLNDGAIFVVYEYMNGGSLDAWLWNRPSRPWVQRLQILLDAANGLAYLHLMHKA